MADSVRLIGPSMPPGFSRATNDDEFGEDDTQKEEISQDDDGAYGPALPPQTGDKTELIGPVLPQHLRRKHQDVPNDDSFDESDVIGPLPLDALSEIKQSAAEEFEARFRRSKEAAQERAQPAPAARETWMTEMPSERMGQQIGLAPRKFRSNPMSSIDKSWSKTPADLQKAAAENGDGCSKKDSFQHTVGTQEDEKIEKSLEKYHRKQRGESLMDMHSKKSAKKRKSEEQDKPTRQPFDREQDLQVNRFDDAQRKSVLKKAALLDTRFSHGARKFE